MIDIKYKKIYDKFIENYKNIHVNPWHEINESELDRIYNELVNKMDINDKYSFKYFINYIIKRLSGSSDAHTKHDVVSLIPINFRIFESDVLINYPKELKNSKLISINEVEISTIIKELEEIITYGTPGKRKYELEKSLFNRYMLFSIPSLRNSDKLVFKIKDINGKEITKTYDKKTDYKEELFNYDEYLHGMNATYKFINDCLIYNHSSVQMKYKEKIEETIEKLRKEDLSNINTIIIDIRGNTGGNSGLNKILIDYLLEHKDKKLICLTDYRVFSAGRYALNDLINIGALTIGEEISTPTNCYGNSNWIIIDEHSFSISECYFNPMIDLGIRSKEEFKKEMTEEMLIPHIFKPDIYIEQTEEDYINGVDTILNYALEYSETFTKKER